VLVGLLRVGGSLGGGSFCRRAGASGGLCRGGLYFLDWGARGGLVGCWDGGVSLFCFVSSWFVDAMSGMGRMAKG